MTAGFQEIIRCLLEYVDKSKGITRRLPPTEGFADGFLHVDDTGYILYGGKIGGVSQNGEGEIGMADAI